MLFRSTNNSSFDFIIFDCQSNPYYDQGTIVGMETADHIIRLITPNVKGIEFEKSQCKWLKNGNFQVDKHIRICSQVKENSPTEEIEAITGKFQYTLPYAAEVEDAFHSGLLPKKFSMTTGILFDAEIEKIMEGILSE